jgi:hypothetical protein
MSHPEVIGRRVWSGSSQDVVGREEAIRFGKASLT